MRTADSAPQPANKIASFRKPGLLNLIFGEYSAGWLFVALILVVDACWLHLSQKSITSQSAANFFSNVFFLLCIATCSQKIGRILHQKEDLATKFFRVSDIAGGLALLLCFSKSIVLLSYLGVSLNMPLIDTYLIRLDAMLGFDWENFHKLIQAHEYIQYMLKLAYQSIRWQAFLIPVFLGLMGYKDDLLRYVFLFMLSCALTIVIATPFPAANTYAHFNIANPDVTSHLTHFDPLRSGVMRVFNLDEIQGLVSMPSFHTTVAILFAYSPRRIPWLFPVGLLLNAAMIAATPIYGGHYLVDLLGGALMAAFVIWLYQVTRGKAERAEKTPAPALTVPTEQVRAS